MTCAGLLVIGLILHLMTGGVDWNSFSWPLNLCVAVAYLVGLVALYSLRKKLYFVRWAMSYKAAIPSLAAVSVLTFCMGMIKQVPGHVPAEGISMFNRMISWWPFVLEYFWMTSIVGLVSLKHLFSFRFQKIPFLLNHFGLFVALVSATLGSADMKRLTMNTRVGQVEWRATDTNGQLTESTGHRTQEFQYRRISSQADADRQCYRKSFARQRTCSSAFGRGCQSGCVARMEY